jgi:hypothetical protein
MGGLMGGEPLRQRLVERGVFGDFEAIGEILELRDQLRVGVGLLRLSLWGRSGGNRGHRQELLGWESVSSCRQFA